MYVHVYRYFQQLSAETLTRLCQVCMRVCMYAYMYVYTWLCQVGNTMYACMYLYACCYVWMYVCIYIFIDIEFSTTQR